MPAAATRIYAPDLRARSKAGFWRYNTVSGVSGKRIADICRDRTSGRRMPAIRAAARASGQRRAIPLVSCTTGFETKVTFVSLTLAGRSRSSGRVGAGRAGR